VAGDATATFVAGRPGVRKPIYSLSRDVRRARRPRRLERHRSRRSRNIFAFRGPRQQNANDRRGEHGERQAGRDLDAAPARPKQRWVRARAWVNLPEKTATRSVMATTPRLAAILCRRCGGTFATDGGGRGGYARGAASDPARARRPYDAAYLELAIRRGLPLQTKTEALIGAARRCSIMVPG
jgi:hypothetical protein